MGGMWVIVLLCLKFHFIHSKSQCLHNGLWISSTWSDLSLFLWTHLLFSPAVLASLLFLEHSGLIPALRSLHYLFLLLEMFFPQMSTGLIYSPPLSFCSNDIFSTRFPLNTVSKIVPTPYIHICYSSLLGSTFYFPTKHILEFYMVHLFIMSILYLFLTECTFMRSGILISLAHYYTQSA